MTISSTKIVQQSFWKIKFCLPKENANNLTKLYFDIYETPWSFMIGENFKKPKEYRVPSPLASCQEVERRGDLNLGCLDWQCCARKSFLIDIFCCHYNCKVSEIKISHGNLNKEERGCENIPGCTDQSCLPKLIAFHSRFVQIKLKRRGKWASGDALILLL
jgi:hypothetical protein